MRTKGSNHCQPPFNQNVGGGVDDGMKCCSEASGDTDVLSPSSSSQQPRSNGSDWSVGQNGSTAGVLFPKADKIRQKYKNSLLEKTPKIFIERLKKEGCLQLENLTVLELQLVNYNPSAFSVFVDMPEDPVAKVKMSRDLDPEQLDITGKLGNLRHAYDEEFSYLTTSQLVFSRTKEDVRACAVMAFLPPRCFILCEEEGTQNKERIFSISNQLKYAVVNGPRTETLSIKPGDPLVGVRMGVFMRVAVLQGDVNQPGGIRCVCLDYNAIYSFERDDLFPLPDEFSVDALPTNAFLARVRGTHYVYPDMYEAVSNEVCKTNGNEGVVPLVTCAIYGRAPDLLTIVDICISIADGWVSERLIRASIAAPFDLDPPVKISPYEAEEMLKDRKRREVARVICSDPANTDESDARVKSRKKNIVCGNCGSEVASRVEPKVKRRGPKVNLPEEVSLSKPSDRDHSEDTATSGADCQRAGSVTEQLMSVARKMQAKEVQEGRMSVSSEEQERSWLWTPQPERAESPPPGIAEPPQAGIAKTDNSSWDDVQISGTKWDWEVDEDEKKVAADTVVATGTGSARFSAPAIPQNTTPIKSEKLSSEIAESSPPPTLQRPLKKIPLTIDYLSSENVQESEKEGLCESKAEGKAIVEQAVARESAAETTRNATAVGRTVVYSPELEESICEEVEPTPSSHAQRPTSKIVWSSEKVPRSGQLDDEKERNKTWKSKGKKIPETMDFSPSKNVEQLEEWPTATNEPVFSPLRAEPPPPLQLQETTPKTGSKAVEVQQISFDEDAGNGSNSNSAMNSMSKMENTATGPRFQRFSAPTVSNCTSSEDEDRSEEDELEMLTRVLKLYKAARLCSKELSPRIRSVDSFVTAAIANGARLLLRNPKTEEQEQIVQELNDIADSYGCAEE